MYAFLGYLISMISIILIYLTGCINLWIVYGRKYKKGEKFPRVLQKFYFTYSRYFNWFITKMDAKNYLYKIQMECFEVFKAQDPDRGDFDVVFEIDGKKLYAHRHRLTAISPTLKSMLSDRWNSSKDEPVKIINYKFEDVKEFLTFIYSGQCNLNDSNIFTMVDMAEFYGVKVFKEACDQYLSKMKFNYENIFELLDYADKYSLHEFHQSLNEFVSQNFNDITKSKKFMKIQKSNIKNMVEMFNNKSLQIEDLFEVVFKWAETRTFEKQKAGEKTFLNDSIKNELKDILPLFKYREMNAEFLQKFVITKSFLFSADELSKIIAAANSKFCVKVYDKNMNLMKGFLNCPNIDKVVAVIQSQKNILSGEYFWRTAQPKPLKPATLAENSKIHWYLCYNSFGDLAIKRRGEIMRWDYLLAEMSEKYGFHIGYGCKIQVVRDI